MALTNGEQTFFIRVIEKFEKKGYVKLGGVEYNFTCLIMREYSEDLEEKWKRFWNKKSFTWTLDNLSTLGDPNGDVLLHAEMRKNMLCLFLELNGEV